MDKQELQVDGVRNAEQAATRREFLAKVGQVGSLSFLALLGLDGLVSMVERGIEERHGAETLGYRVAEELGVWALDAVAEASCPQTYSCTGNNPVHCSSGYNPPCSMDHKFGCVVRDNACEGFSCPHGIAAYNCDVAGGNHNCSGTVFTCTSFDSQCYTCNESPYNE